MKRHQRQQKWASYILLSLFLMTACQMPTPNQALKSSHDNAQDHRSSLLANKQNISTSKSAKLKPLIDKYIEKYYASPEYREAKLSRSNFHTKNHSPYYEHITSTRITPAEREFDFQYLLSLENELPASAQAIDSRTLRFGIENAYVANDQDYLIYSSDETETGSHEFHFEL